MYGNGETRAYEQGTSSRSFDQPLAVSPSRTAQIEKQIVELSQVAAELVGRLGSTADRFVGSQPRPGQANKSVEPNAFGMFDEWSNQLSYIRGLLNEAHEEVTRIQSA